MAIDAGVRRDERALPPSDVEDALALQLPVCLQDGSRIHDELRGELAHRRQRVLRPKGADDEGTPHFVHDLEVQGPPISRVEVYQQHWRGRVAVWRMSATLYQTFERMRRFPEESRPLLS